MLTLDQVSIDIDGQPIVEDVSLHMSDGDISCLLGPSGCGKTTLLRAIAGFQELRSGSISLQENGGKARVLSSPGRSVRPENRRVGMVFQDFALFPHLTAVQNVAFGLKNIDLSKNPRDGLHTESAVLKALFELVRLEGTEDRYPHELSGGQQQRVALARALAPGPRLLLLDEPFSSLDAELRGQLSLEVRDILKDFGIAAILVTHDQQEAFAFADQVGLLQDGRLQQWDTAFNLYHEPINREVADFIGRGTFLPGVLSSPNSIETELGTLVGNRAYTWPQGTPVEVLLRPDDVELVEHAHRGLEAKVHSKVFSGSATLYTLSLPTGSRLVAEFPSHHDFAIGDSLRIESHVEHLIAFRYEL